MILEDFFSFLYTHRVVIVMTALLIWMVVWDTRQ